MVKSKIGESFKQKLFMVYFKDGYKKPVMGKTKDDVIKVVKDEGERDIDDIEKIVIEQNYYPMNEDYYDV